MESSCFAWQVSGGAGMAFRQDGRKSYGRRRTIQVLRLPFFLLLIGMKKRIVMKAGWWKALRRLCGAGPCLIYLKALRRLCGAGPCLIYLPAARRRALPILRKRRGPLRRLRLRSFPSFAARWSITEPIWLYSAIAGKCWSAPQGTASMDIPSSAYIKTARSWKKTESARP